jgi:hypothetical protein
MDGASVIGRRHPLYDRMIPKWKFWLDSYELTLEEYSSLYLYKNEKEGKEEFNERRSRSYHENHTKRVVDLVNSYLYKEKPTRRYDNKHIEGFVNNVDGTGTDIDQFLKTCSIYSSLLGRVYIVVDQRQNSTPTGTYLDTLESQVYSYMVLPQDVPDIAFDDQGRVKWAVVREWYRDDDDPFVSSGDMKERFRLWMPGKWFLFDDGGTVVEQGTTGFDTVPIVCLNNERSQNKYLGLPLVQDIAYLDRSIYNNWSKLDVIVNDQTFSQLIMPIESSILGSSIQDEKLREQYLQFSTKRVILYSSQAASKPEFISPDATQAQFILDMLKTQTRQLYASLGLEDDGSASGGSTDSSSGQSKAHDFEKVNNMLASKADNIEQADKEIVELFKAWKDIASDYYVSYPDNFDTKSLQQEVLLAQELSLLDISDSFIREVNKRVVIKALPEMPTDLRDKIFKEIDEKPIISPDALNSAQDDLASMNDDNNGNDNFADKKAKGKKGGRLDQSQDKADQM